MSQTDLNRHRSAAGWIRQGRRALAAGAVQRLQDRQPEFVDSYGPRGFSELITDTEIRLEYILAALRFDEPALLADHLAWLKVSFHARGLSDAFLELHLDAIAEELTAQVPESERSTVIEVLTNARAAVEGAPCELPSLIEDSQPHADTARSYLLAVLEGRRRDAEKLVLDLTDSGVSVGEVERYVISAAQQEIGRMWQLGEIHAAEEHAATRIAEGLGTILRSRAEAEPIRGKRVLLASVGGNDHDLAIRILADRFEIAGWQAICLGADSPGDSIAQAADDHAVHLVALSATTALHVETAEHVIQELRAMPDGDKRPILIGGRPFELIPDLHERLGADATAASLDDAIGVAESLVK